MPAWPIAPFHPPPPLTYTATPAHPLSPPHQSSPYPPPLSPALHSAALSPAPGSRPAEPSPCCGPPAPKPPCGAGRAPPLPPRCGSAPVKGGPGGLFRVVNGFWGEMEGFCPVWRGGAFRVFLSEGFRGKQGVGGGGDEEFEWRGHNPHRRSSPWEQDKPRHPTLFHTCVYSCTAPAG